LVIIIVTSEEVVHVVLFLSGLLDFLNGSSSEVDGLVRSTEFPCLGGHVEVASNSGEKRVTVDSLIPGSKGGKGCSLAGSKTKVEEESEDSVEENVSKGNIISDEVL